MSSFAAGPASGGIGVDPVRDFIRRQQQEREAQKVQQAKQELDEWLRQNPEPTDDPAAAESDSTRPSQNEDHDLPPPPPPPPAVSLADDASIKLILDQSTAKNLLAFLPTIIFWFAVALSAFLLAKTLHFVLPYAFALTAKILSFAVWSTSKALYWSSRAIVGLLWLAAWVSRLACWLLLLAWPLVAWVGGCFLLPRGSGLRRLSLMAPPPVWFVLVFLRARWWMTWPVAVFGLARGGAALAHGPTRREAADLAKRGLVEGWTWVAEGGFQRQWQQVLYGWESANPDRHADSSPPAPADAVASDPTAVAAPATDLASAPPNKPVPAPTSPPSSPKASPKRRKKPSIG